MITAVLNPRDLPDLRAELLEYYGDGFIPSSEDSGAAAAALRSSVREAELFHVSSDMCTLAVEAGKTIESFELQPEDIPSHHCLIWFERPVFAAVHLVSLTMYQHRLLVGLFFSREVAVEFYKQPDLERFRGGETPPPGWMEGWKPRFLRMMGVDVPFGQRFDDPAWPMLPEIGAPLVSALLLMQQSVSASNMEYPSRASRRRLERTHAPTEGTRVITLRRRRSDGAVLQASDHREYIHQWIVRGHWRQQWYPARQVHRPVWIDPHLKGPEGAPLLGGEKVYAWHR